MKVTYDDTPDEGQDATYAPRALPGFEQVATPVQGLLWADIAGGLPRERKPAKRATGHGPDLFGGPDHA